LLIGGAAWSDGINRVASFDLVTGSISGVTAGVIANIEPASNEMFICSIGFTPDISISATTQFRFTQTGNGVDGLYVWGADMCATQYRGSHIRTEDAAVTRQIDYPVVIAPDFDSWYTQGEGTFIADVSMLNDAVGNYPTILLSATDGNNLIASYGNGQKLDLQAAEQKLRWRINRMTRCLQKMDRLRLQTRLARFPLARSCLSVAAHTIPRER
jgi:hypothetical protein